MPARTPLSQSALVEQLGTHQRSDCGSPPSVLGRGGPATQVLPLGQATTLQSRVHAWVASGLA